MWLENKVTLGGRLCNITYRGRGEQEMQAIYELVEALHPEEMGPVGTVTYDWWGATRSFQITLANLPDATFAQLLLILAPYITEPPGTVH